MDNRTIAAMLSETADLMEIAGEDAFRIRSYRNAANVIEGYPEQIADILRNPARSVTEIPGIGKGLAAALAEIAARGSFERRDEMLAKYPPTALELLKIQGMGPKSIRALWEHYRVSTIDDLERVAREQKLRELPRMGAKLEEKVLRSIAAYRQSAGRFLLDFADRAAAGLIAYLSEAGGIEKITVAGSLRRRKETVGDVDILATGPGAQAALDRFAVYPDVKEVLGKGENKASAKIGTENLQVDLRALPHENFGAALQYFSGSKDHNVALRNRAIHMGFKLNEYGLFRASDEARVAGESEEEVYSQLGLAWIPPELRENQGEIDAAAEGRLPHLVEPSDIRGDLHMHTTESDGRATMLEMAEAARALGHQYIAITDHSKALAMANGLDEARVVAFAKHVREVNRDGAGIRIFSGIECDIRKDGSMDLAGDALAELDFVIGSIHSSMNLEADAMTDRLLKALECPYLCVLGHPTGRELLHREAYSYDFDRVAREAVRRGVAFEINSSPARLDLHAALIRAARAHGARFVVSTDAHHPKHLAGIHFGVSMARRGWLTAGDIWNTRPLNEFLGFLKKERS